MTTGLTSVSVPLAECLVLNCTEFFVEIITYECFQLNWIYEGGSFSTCLKLFPLWNEQFLSPDMEEGIPIISQPHPMSEKLCASLDS
jgi:hypothetical protein